MRQRCWAVWQHGRLPVIRLKEPASSSEQWVVSSKQEQRGSVAPLFYLCAEHVRQPGGESPLLNLMEVKG